MKGNGCYIDVWKEANFGGETVRIQGPAEYPRLQFEQGDWGDSISSLRVGPNAFVIAYRDEDFGGEREVTFGPCDEIADLGELKFEDEIDSMRVIDSLRIFDRVEYNEGRAGGQGGRRKNKGRGR